MYIHSIFFPKKKLHLHIVRTTKKTSHLLLLKKKYICATKDKYYRPDLSKSMCWPILVSFFFFSFFFCYCWWFGWLVLSLIFVSLFLSLFRVLFGFVLKALHNLCIEFCCFNVYTVLVYWNVFKMWFSLSDLIQLVVCLLVLN